MSHNIKIIAVEREQPDARLYVLALIAMARQLQEEESAGGGNSDASPPPREENDDG
jgi:hypothetical protein